MKRLIVASLLFAVIAYAAQGPGPDTPPRIEIEPDKGSAKIVVWVSTALANQRAAQRDTNKFSEQQAFHGGIIESAILKLQESHKISIRSDADVDAEADALASRIRAIKRQRANVIQN